MTPLTTKAIQVQYFAILREQRGISAESVSTAADTPRALYEELRQRHGLSVPPELLRIAVNEEFAEWDTPLEPHDTVVFIPPVAGG